MKMKRIAFLSFLLMFCVACVAQSNHMKFAGIPLTGTIVQFEKKLLEKGYVLRSETNKLLPAGTRAFRGVFAGEKANVAVYYDTDTKIVYSAKAYYADLTEERSKDKLEYLKSLMESKYGEDCVLEGTDDNGTAEFTVITELGNIYGYIKKDAKMNNYPYYYSTHVEYYDNENSTLHRNNVMDDL